MNGCIFITAADSRNGFTLAGFQQLIADSDTILDVVCNLQRKTLQA